MKSNLLSLTVAALLCCTPFAASARDTGRGVGAQFDSTILNAPSKIEFKPISRGEQMSFGIDGQAAAANECQWQVLNIPVRIGASKVTAINDKKVYPNFVPAVTFHVYLLIDPENATDKAGKNVDKKKRPIILDKEITYVNIPLKKEQGTSVGEEKVDVVAHINVGVFLSPSDIRRIVEKDTAEWEDPKGAKAQPHVKILALAMEAKYSGAACWYRDKTAKDDDIKVDNSLKSWLPANWWKKSGVSNRGAKLMSINETPFAAAFYPTYCATQPMYGSSGSSAAPASPSSLTPTSALGDPQETTAADAAAGDDAATTTDTPADTTADTTDSEPTSGSGGRKSRKGRSSRN